MSQINYIVGTTASGKTSLALRMSVERPSLLVSADSRQLYRGMDIVTGKDHPSTVEIFGIDLVNPEELGSVSLWYDHVKPVIDQGLSGHKQIIVVGGTGLYVRALCTGISSIHIPINLSLRQSLDSLTVSELKDKLQALSPHKYNSMNHSDQNNPRRLIRALEIAQAKVKATKTQVVYRSTNPIIGLYYADLSLQEKVIKTRVIHRLDGGAIEETQNLINHVGESVPSMTALGYREITSYLKGQINRTQLVDLWTKSELSYVKRQLTFFRKQNVVWYDRGRMTIEEIYEHISS